jgi:putative ABC transport system substrate-binding protein
LSPPPKADIRSWHHALYVTLDARLDVLPLIAILAWLLLGRHMRRREFISLVGSVVTGWPFAARAQRANIPKIGVLWPGAMPPTSPRMEAFRLALRQFDYVEGQSVAIELRYAEKGVRQLPELAAELVRLKVDVITAFGDLAPKVAQQATDTIPIVAICDDIVGAGLVPSLAHPGANITGFTILSPELSAKRLELLKELVPGLSRVAGLWDPTTGKAQVTESENAASAMNLNLQILEVRNRDSISGALAAARDGRAEAINVFASPILASLHREIITLAAEYRLLSVARSGRGWWTAIVWSRSRVDVATEWGDRGQDCQR